MGRPRANPEERNKYILENQIVNFNKPTDPRFIDHSGEYHGKLEILYYIGQDRNHVSYYMAKCECGAKVIVNIMSVRAGYVKSCGCIHREQLRERNTTHGLSTSKLYSVWVEMIHRCYNPHDKRYLQYGGRNITVCDEWLSYNNESSTNTGFLNFYNWSLSNGYEDGLSIDRINNDKGYCPENCRWVDSDIQANNKQNTRYIKYKGYCFSAKIWSKITGISAGQIRYRDMHGWTPEETLRTPCGNKRGHGYLCWEVKPEFIKYHKKDE